MRPLSGAGNKCCGRWGHWRGRPYEGGPQCALLGPHSLVLPLGPALAVSGPWGSVRTEAAVTEEKYHPEFRGVEKLDRRGLMCCRSTV